MRIMPTLSWALPAKERAYERPTHVSENAGRRRGCRISRGVEEPLDAQQRPAAPAPTSVTGIRKSDPDQHAAAGASLRRAVRDGQDGRLRSHRDADHHAALKRPRDQGSIAEGGPPHPFRDESAHWREPMSSARSRRRERSVQGMEASLKNAALWGADAVLLVPGVVDATNAYRDVWTRSQRAIRERLLPMARDLKVDHRRSKRCGTSSC